MCPAGYLDMSFNVLYFLRNGSLGSGSNRGRSNFGSWPLLLTWVDGWSFSSFHYGSRMSPKVGRHPRLF